MKTQQWFAVDKAGLAAVIQRRGMGFVVSELVQNAWDEDVRQVDVTLQWQDRTATLTVEDDDPDGFTDLRHTYTLFAPSEKKADPTRRGRFNLGEKLVLSVCKSARIETTTGTVIFDGKGRGTRRSCRERGSRFVAEIPMTKAQFEEVCLGVRMLIPPVGIITTFNGQSLERPADAGSLQDVLTTEIAGADGILSRSKRIGTVEFFVPRPGELAWLYELGIPVCETGDRWHYNVGQKVPLTMDRENVPESYLRDVRLLALNAKYLEITAEDANSEWVETSAANPRALPQAVKRYMDLRFGEKRVSYDPSDPEANKIAVSKGYTVVHGGMMSSGAWENAREAGAINPAGQVCPSSPERTEAALQLPKDKWTAGMKAVVEYAVEIGKELLGFSPRVNIVDNPNPLVGTLAMYGDRTLTLNVGRLGTEWFERGIIEEVDALLIHEYGHEYSGDHLSSEYYDALCILGAKLKRLALEKPELFAPFMECVGVRQ